MFTIQKFEVNPLQENCYIVSDETKECVIIDCGALFTSERLAIKDYIEKNELSPVHLLNTHLHFDHVWGNSYLYSTFGLMTEANQHDMYLYEDVHKQVLDFCGQNWEEDFFAPLGKGLVENDIITFGNHKLSVIATPGHTPGGICFYCEEEKVLFSGDSLFQCSIGRTDFEHSVAEDLLSSLKEKILTLPENVTVYTGHGPATDILTEKKYNPYLT